MHKPIVININFDMQPSYRNSHHLSSVQRNRCHKLKIQLWSFELGKSQWMSYAAWLPVNTWVTRGGDQNWEDLVLLSSVYPDHKFILWQKPLQIFQNLPFSGNEDTWNRLWFQKETPPLSGRPHMPAGSSGSPYQAAATTSERKSCKPCTGTVCIKRSCLGDHITEIEQWCFHIYFNHLIQNAPSRKIINEEKVLK